MYFILKFETSFLVPPHLAVSDWKLHDSNFETYRAYTSIYQHHGYSAERNLSEE